MKLKDGAFVVLFKNNRKDQVFLVRRSDINLWNSTGGAIEKNEKPAEAALREAKEETGFQVKIIKAIGVYKKIEPFNLSHNSFLYEGRVISGKFKPEFPGCLGKWFPADNLPLNMTKRDRQRIFDAKNYTGVKPFKKTIRQNISDNYNMLFFDLPGSLRFIMRKLKEVIITRYCFLQHH